MRDKHPVLKVIDAIAVILILVILAGLIITGIVLGIIEIITFLGTPLGKYIVFGIFIVSVIWLVIRWDK